MYEQIQLLRNYLRMAWLYRWIGVALAISACIGGWTFVYLMPDQYQVGTKIYLDSSSMLRPLLKGLAFDNSMLSNTALMLRRTLLTRPNLEDVARRADLDLKAQTPQQFDAIVTGLGKKITIASTKTDHIYDITYRADNPKVAKSVIDELLNVFLEASLGDSRRETATTQRFIDEQIAEYEKRLILAEDRLKEFKQRNIGVMPGSQGGYFNKLQETHAQLKQAELDLQEATRRRDDIKNMASSQPEGGDESLFSMDYGEEEMTSPEIESLNARIENFELRIDELLIQFTEKHPDVIGARRTIAHLEEQKEQKLTELAEWQLENPAMPGMGPTTDPYKQQLKLQVVEAEAQVGALQTRVKEYQSRVADLERKVDTVPEVEAELARLDRDYSINRQQYNELLERRELAHMSQEADAAVDDVKIKIIEPPRVPLSAAGPPRLLFISFTLAVSLVLGGAVSFVLSQLNPRIIGDVDLRSVTLLPVLGAVGMTENPVHRRQRRMELAVFGMSLSGLIAVYVGQVVLLQSGIDLHEKLTSIIGGVL
jgi:protein tyrosine kinase modulator